MSAPGAAPTETSGEEPVAEPEPQSPQAEAPPEAPEGGEPESAEETVDLSQALKGLSAAQLRAVLESAPEEARQEIESAIEARGEQRARTRSQEKTTATTDRRQAFTQRTALGASAEAWVRQQAQIAEQGGAIDTRTLTRAIEDIRQAGIAENALAVESEIEPLFDKYLPERTSEEEAKLEKHVYEWARSGQPKHLATVMELVRERALAEGEALGVKKGEGNKKAREELIDKLQNAQKIKQQTAGVTPNGRATNASDVRAQIVDEINAIDPFRDPEAQSKLDALKYKLKGL